MSKRDTFYDEGENQREMIGWKRIPVGSEPAKQRFKEVDEQLNKKPQELEKHIRDLRIHKETFDALETKFRLCNSQLDDDILSGARALLSEEGY